MEEKNITLSVALAVFNEEKNLSGCLASVRDIANEIIVLDGGSTDKTVAIAESFGARVVKTSNPAMFHTNKQKALDACRGEWILQLDADEVVPSDLKEEILSAVNDERSTMNGFYIPRKNYFLKHWLRKGGQYPDYVIRLVRRGKARFPQKSVHEQIAVDGEVGYLKNPMLHYSYKTRADYWRKADAYTSLTAKTVSRSSFLQYVLLKPVATFLSLFIRHKGIMDGLPGFEFALYSALHYPWAYMKRLLLVLLLASTVLLFTPPVHANYVLPYPSFMPGNKIYKVTRVIDKLKAYWHWGEIGQRKYHMALSDKYLVEAKTLFEYKQYLLAVDALGRSNEHILVASSFEQKEEQRRVLEKIRPEVPEEFTWTPEKAEATQLSLHEFIDTSIAIRQQ